MGASNSSDSWFSNGGWLKAIVLLVVVLFGGYSVVLMYANGEIPFAVLTLLVLASGVFVFSNPKTYAHRYIFPGVAGMVIFIIFPMLYNIGISFTNYSGTNLLSLERVQEYHLSQTYQVEGGSFKFKVLQTDNGYRLGLTSEETGKHYVTGSLQLIDKDEIEEQELKTESLPYIGSPVDAFERSDWLNDKAEPIKRIIQLRTHLSELKLKLPNGTVLSMSGLRKFSALKPLFTRLADGAIINSTIIINDANTLMNNQTGRLMRPNMETGFYQYVNEHNEFVGERVPPGFAVGVGWKNYIRALTDKGIQQPFLQIFIWTVAFAGLSVLFTLAIGMVLASLVQWEELKGKGVYRVVLILPYAVPAFISILVFKGLFNQNFGEINLALGALFNIAPENFPSWYTDPWMAKAMILIVNTWLGYPYMMILCMGLLKAIPEDLYEASAMDGAGPIHNFFKITVPLLMKPLTPLLIASFAFNFNNFVLIELLTSGSPDIIGANPQAGHTDILVSYTYQIAFEAQGQDYGLAAAIGTIIFLMVGGMALLNLKFTKANG